MTISVCLLCYGDFPELARRCLGSIVPHVDPRHVADVRVGLNAVSPATEEYVLVTLDSLPVPVRVIQCHENRLKYPVMRRLFRRWPLEAPLIMWFDDDSYIREHVSSDWMATLPERMGRAAMLGQRYRLRRPLTPAQQDWVRQQSWYTGRSLDQPPRFITGGWWVIRSDVVLKHDWPPPCARHCGGDYTLGVLLDQQRLEVVNVPGDVAVNKERRRGENPALHLHLGGPQCRTPVDPFPCRVLSKRPGDDWYDANETL